MARSISEIFSRHRDWAEGKCQQVEVAVAMAAGVAAGLGVAAKAIPMPALGGARPRPALGCTCLWPASHSSPAKRCAPFKGLSPCTSPTLWNTSQFASYSSVGFYASGGIFGCALARDDCCSCIGEPVLDVSRGGSPVHAAWAT